MEKQDIKISEVKNTSDIFLFFAEPGIFLLQHLQQLLVYCSRRRNSDIGGIRHALFRVCIYNLVHGSSSVDFFRYRCSIILRKAWDYE